MLRKFFRKSASNSNPAPRHLRASLLCHSIQEDLNSLAPKVELAQVIVQRNYWALTTLLLIAGLLVCITAYFYQTIHYQNNVRTLIVKLYPNGQYDIQKVTFDKMPNYFITTLNSLMSQYAERRYSKLSDSIASDYGFAYQFMSPELRNHFLNEYHAGSVAHDIETCKSCEQIKVSVGAIQHYENDQTIINAKPDREYRSTIFLNISRSSHDGSFIEKQKKILTLVWRIKSLEELNNTISSIRADPIGLVIMRATVKDDPTSKAIKT